VGRMRLEGGAELRPVEQAPQASRDAAGDVDPAERLEGERERAGEPPEQPREQPGRRLRFWLARERAGDDGLRLAAVGAGAERASGRRPGPDSTHSALTLPHPRRSRSNTSTSSAACGPNAAWPPSLAITSNRPGAGPVGTSAATPSPVPGPSTTLTPLWHGTGHPNGRRPAAARR